MSNTLVRDMAVWGIALETTIGTGVLPTIGFPNLQRTPIRSGASWSENPRATGKTVDSTVEVKADVANPTWNPTTTLFHPHAGMLFAALCHNSSQSGAGPYVQTIQPDMLNGKKIIHADTASATGRTLTATEKIGQTGSRDLRIAGGCINRIDIKSGSSGLIEVTTSWLFTAYNDGVDASSGVFTMPGSTIEKLSTDFVLKFGAGTPAALYTEEWTISLIANVTPKRGGGLNPIHQLYPWSFVYNSWSVEGSFSRPVPVGAGRLAANYVVEGGAVSTTFPLYIYSRTLADYNTVLATDGQMRFTLCVRLDDPELDMENETNERVTFKGKEDGTLNIFKFEQATTATQASWAT